MIQFGKPKDIENYIEVTDDDYAYYLQVKGLMPYYKDFEATYFKKEEVEELKEGGEKNV